MGAINYNGLGTLLVIFNSVQHFLKTCFTPIIFTLCMRRKCNISPDAFHLEHCLARIYFVNRLNGPYIYLSIITTIKIDKLFCFYIIMMIIIII